MPISGLKSALIEPWPWIVQNTTSAYQEDYIQLSYFEIEELQVMNGPVTLVR